MDKGIKKLFHSSCCWFNIHMPYDNYWSILVFCKMLLWLWKRRKEKVWRRFHTELVFYDFYIIKVKLLLKGTFLPEVLRYTGPEWPRRTWQPSSIHVRHRTSLLRLHGHFGPVYLLQVSKNDDEERCFLK